MKPPIPLSAILQLSFEHPRPEDFKNMNLNENTNIWWIGDVMVARTYFANNVCIYTLVENDHEWMWTVIDGGMVR